MSNDARGRPLRGSTNNKVSSLIFLLVRLSRCISAFFFPDSISRPRLSTITLRSRWERQLRFQHFRLRSPSISAPNSTSFATMLRLRFRLRSFMRGEATSVSTFSTTFSTSGALNFRFIFGLRLRFRLCSFTRGEVTSVSKFSTAFSTSGAFNFRSNFGLTTFSTSFVQRGESRLLFQCFGYVFHFIRDHIRLRGHW